MGLSDVALNGIQALGESALLLCNDCVCIKQQIRMKLSSWTKQTQEKETKNLESEMKNRKTSVEETKAILQQKPQAEV